MSVQLSNLVSYFKNAPAIIDKEFEKNHIQKKIPKNQFIAMEGEDCSFLPIISKGRIRIYTVSSNGNEMTLYRIGKGESCVLTISCLLTDKKFPALAFTEEDTEVLLVQSNVLKNWINKYSEWRNFTFDYMSNIIFKVLELLEDSKFNRTEIRLIEFILDKTSNESDVLKFTHQQIASEIGTSREVISRILKELESEDYIQLSRGSIKILNRKKLQSKNLLI